MHDCAHSDVRRVIGSYWAQADHDRRTHSLSCGDLSAILLDVSLSVFFQSARHSDRAVQLAWCILRSDFNRTRRAVSNASANNRAWHRVQRRGHDIRRFRAVLRDLVDTGYWYTGSTGVLRDVWGGSGTPRLAVIAGSRGGCRVEPYKRGDGRFLNASTVSAFPFRDGSDTCCRGNIAPCSAPFSRAMPPRPDSPNGRVCTLFSFRIDPPESRSPCVARARGELETGFSFESAVEASEPPASTSRHDSFGERFLFDQKLASFHARFAGADISVVEAEEGASNVLNYARLPSPGPGEHAIAQPATGQSAPKLAPAASSQP